MPLTVYWFVEPTLSLLAKDDLDAPKGAPTSIGVATQSSDEQFEALLNGTADAAITAMDNVMDWNLRPGGGDFRIVAQIERTTPLSLVARNGISSIDDLKGGTLLVDAPENGFVVAARALLEDAGVSFGSYSLLSAGGVRERFEALLAGQGTATILGPPFDAFAVSRGAKILARVNDRYPAFPGQGLVVRQSACGRIQNDLTSWVEALERARHWGFADRRAAASQLAETGMPPSLAEIFAGLVPASLVPDRDGVDLLIAQRRRAGLRGGNMTYQDIVDTSLLGSTLSIAEANG
jgi:ABC-type nitrate/sulfonate/bicarbonate transport system substrate-binding protein